MIKKMFCFVLAVVMLLGVFATGCSKSSDDETIVAKADTEESSRLATTVSMWLPTDAKTTDEAAKLVEAAINKLTQAKYNTAVELHLIPRDEYQETIDKKLDDVAEARIAAEEAEEAERLLQKNGKETVTEDTEDSSEIGAYPAVNDDQLDIFFVSGYDNYMKYIDADYLSMLDGELGSNSKILKQYIYPTFLNMADEFGIYAIPNNHPVGEYQYLLINRELVEKYDYDPDNFTSLIRTKSFIIDMGNQNIDGLVPLLAPAESSGMIYWGPEGFSDEFSLISVQFGDETTFKTHLDPYATLTNSAFTNLYIMMRELDSLGYVGDGTLEEGEKFAVGIVSGDATVAAQYEDEYFVRIHQAPVCYEDDVFGAMLGVSTYTKDLSRAMEIVTFLNTNKDMRTVLQYGVENVHWEYEDDSKETIRIISDDYVMELNETGNAYYTYPGEGISMDYWELEKQQNLDSVSFPYCKFTTYRNDENKDVLDRIAEYSKDVKKRLDECPFEELSQLIKDIRKEVNANADIKAMLDPENENSLFKIYNEWFSDLYPELS